MPYNKKNSVPRDGKDSKFDKKSTGGKKYAPKRENSADGGYNKGRSGPEGDKRFNSRDKDELAPPRFLPPKNERPFPGKRNDSRPPEKRHDKPFMKGPADNRNNGTPNKRGPSHNEWGADDLAKPKYFENGPKKSYNDRPSGARPGAHNRDKPFKKEWSDNKGPDSFRPKKEGDRPTYDAGQKGKKPFADRADRSGRGSEPFKPKMEGDERKPFKPKYETEVKGRKPYNDKFVKTNDKSVKTPNERKKELLGNVDESGDIRLNKYIANSGICARREADELIKKGLVTVNDKVVTEMGHKVKREDVVKYEGRRILPEPFVYILMNKPKDFITTTDDEKGRKTVMDLLADKIPQRIYPIGRLDRNTTGVLLLTNDGEVAQALTHPAFEIKKIYHVVLDKKVSSSDLDKLVEGVTLEDGMVFADAVSYVDSEDKSHVGVEIHSGKNRVVRRMFELLGYEVEKLDRVSVGVFTKKDLPRGKWRFLSQSEVGFLMKLKSKMP